MQYTQIYQMSIFVCVCVCVYYLLLLFLDPLLPAPFLLLPSLTEEEDERRIEERAMSMIGHGSLSLSLLSSFLKRFLFSSLLVQILIRHTSTDGATAE